MITAPFNNMPTHYMAAVNHSYHNNQQTLKKKKLRRTVLATTP